MRNFAQPALAMVDSMRRAATAQPASAIAFGGAPGSNSHQAAMQFAPDALPLPFLGFEEVPILWLMLVVIGGGTLVGALGSGMALRRFLKI